LPRSQVKDTARCWGSVRIFLASRAQKRAIDGFVRHAHLEVVRVVHLQSGTDLLRRPPRVQQRFHLGAEPGTLVALCDLGSMGPLVGGLVSATRPIPPGPPVAVDLGTRGKEPVQDAVQSPDTKRRPPVPARPPPAPPTTAAASSGWFVVVAYRPPYSAVTVPSLSNTVRPPPLPRNYGLHR
jgi:hypothetical protein